MNVDTWIFHAAHVTSLDVTGGIAAHRAERTETPRRPREEGAAAAKGAGCPLGEVGSRGTPPSL